VQSVFLIVAIYFSFSVLLPLPRFDIRHVNGIIGALLVLVPTAIFMLLQLLLSLSIVQLKLSAGKSTALAVACLAVWITVLAYFHPYHRVDYETLIFFRLCRFALLGIFLTLSITCLGCLLSLIIKEPALLLPVALIAMPIDYLGAMTPIGFTHDMVAHASKFVSSVSVAVPTISVHGVSISPIAYIGPGDVLFMSMFFACVQRFSLAERGTFWWMYGLLTFSMIVVITATRPFPIAALVPMGLAVIIANLGLIKLKREEIFAVVYAGIMILVIVCVFYFYSHRHFIHMH
jgi:hypothetical protein